eukprot:969566-Pyramimonas_sp.AAC.1
MTDAAQSNVHECGWRLQSGIQIRRFRTDAETCAFTRASNSFLAFSDRVQSSFLRNVGTVDLDALHQFKLAPVCSRRDIVFLGLIHRTLLGTGPAVEENSSIRAPPRNFFRAVDPCHARARDYAIRSTLGGASH